MLPPVQHLHHPLFPLPQLPLIEAPRLGALASDVRRQIVSNARAATGASLVVLSSYDKSQRMVRVEALAGLDTPAGRGALRLAQRVLRGFDPLTVSLPLSANPFQAAVYTRGETVSAPFLAVARGAVPNPLLRIVTRVLNIHHTVVAPLYMQGEVVGSLSFHTSNAPSQAAEQMLRAFADQASLTLENAALSASLQDHLAALEAARRLVSHADEANKQHLAEILHGAVQTQLLVVELGLRKAIDLLPTDQAAAIGLLADARTRIDALREQEIRQVSHLLHPSITRLGLGPAVRSLARQYQGVMDVIVRLPAELEYVGYEPAETLPQETCLGVYRVLEEALTNAHRHGHARQATLSVELGEGPSVAVTVQDNGEGFNPADAARGLGFSIIEMRVADAGGKWYVTSGRDQGTTVRAVFPIAPPRAGVTAPRVALGAGRA